MKITVNQGVDKKRIPPVKPGSHVGILYSIIYLGHLPNMFEPSKYQPKIQFTFELPNVTHDFEDKGKLPQVVSWEERFYTSSKSNFIKHMKTWLGDFDNLDLAELLGKAAALTIAQKQAKAGHFYNVVKGINPLMEGVAYPERVNDLFIFSVDEWDQEKFDKMHEYTQNKIKESLEYKKMFGASDHVWDDKAAKMLNAFMQAGVSQSLVLEKAGVEKASEIDEAQIEELREIYRRIINGEPIGTFFKPSKENSGKALDSLK